VPHGMPWLMSQHEECWLECSTPVADSCYQAMTVYYQAMTVMMVDGPGGCLMSLGHTGRGCFYRESVTAAAWRTGKACSTCCACRNCCACNFPAVQCGLMLLIIV
jgi:hypothetical protein